MHRFFIFEEQENFKEVIVPNKELSHQLKKVLRIRENEKFVCIYKNFELVCKMDGDVIVVLEWKEFVIDNKFKTILVQGIATSNKISLIIQKATELGVDEIVLWQSKRSTSKIDDFSSKEERYNKIIVEACEQCRRNDIPTIRFVKNINDIGIDNDAVILYENEEQLMIKEFLSDYNKDQLFVVIGPEGGIEESELKEFTDKGARIASLGKNILRTETAAINSISIVNYEKK